MSRKTFYITLCVVFSLLIAVLVLASCTADKAEQEIAEIDTYLSEATESTRTAETTTAKEIHTETATTVSEPTEEATTVSVEEVANIIISNGINGDERKAYLGDRYEEVQKWIDENYITPETSYRQVGEADEYGISYEEYDYSASYSVLNPYDGINYFDGVLETYYNMDMSGVVDWMHSLGYGGEYWVRSDGVKMLGDYVMVAADYGWMPKGSIVETSLGTGIVCDTGEGGWYWYDIAVEW